MMRCLTDPFCCTSADVPLETLMLSDTDAHANIQGSRGRNMTGSSLQMAETQKGWQRKHQEYSPKLTITLDVASRQHRKP